MKTHHTIVEKVIHFGEKIVVCWAHEPSNTTIRRWEKKLGTRLNYRAPLVSWNGSAKSTFCGVVRYSRKTLRKLGKSEISVPLIPSPCRATPMISRALQRGYAAATKKRGWGNWPRPIFESLVKERYSWGSPISFERKAGAFLP